MNIDNIPGWFSGTHQIETIRLLHIYNNPDCIGVEVGCLHGRSSYAISVAINKGKLYSIDLWDNRETYDSTYSDEDIVKYKLPHKGLRNSLEFFLENTKDRKNIIPIQGGSPEIVQDWTMPIDFIFLDASHKNPNDRDNIDFWLPKIKPGGMFLGHDWYEDRRLPDVNLNVEYMEDLLKQKVTIIPKTSIWYFVLPKI
jgi:predicted O-methyltransferase YrrM